MESTTSGLAADVPSTSTSLSASYVLRIATRGVEPKADGLSIWSLEGTSAHAYLLLLWRCLILASFAFLLVLSFPLPSPFLRMVLHPQLAELPWLREVQGEEVGK